MNANLVLFYLSKMFLTTQKGAKGGQTGSFSILLKNAKWHITLPFPKIQQTKMLFMCQRFGDLFLFGLLASFLSGRFTTMAVINPPERKLAKRTSLH